MALLVLLAACANPRAVRSGDWAVIHPALPPATGPNGTWDVGGEAANPVIEIPVVDSVGRWIRFTGVAPDPSSAMQFRINVYRDRAILTRSVPSLCNAEGRCTTVTWVPFDATRVEAVVWAQMDEGIARDLSFEIGVAASENFRDRSRTNQFVTMLRSEYYRAHEADWIEIERRVDAMSPAPSDIDPLPTTAQYIRDQLPGNAHMFIVPATFSKTDSTTAPMPTCSDLGAAFGIIVVPGISAIEGDGPERYAKTLQDCLMSSGDERTWVVDLRRNGGGNMYPMISGVSPLLEQGPLYAFVDGNGKPTTRIGITPYGLTVNDRRYARATPTPDVGRRTHAPVIVLLGPHCGSSCEQVANALATRSRTLFVGEDTAGLTSTNERYRLNEDFALLITTGYTADPCGHPIVDRLHPDILFDHVDERAIADLLTLPDIRQWLASTHARGSQPVSHAEREARCARIGNPRS